MRPSPTCLVNSLAMSALCSGVVTLISGRPQNQHGSNRKLRLRGSSPNRSGLPSSISSLTLMRTIPRRRILSRKRTSHTVLRHIWLHHIQRLYMPAHRMQLRSRRLQLMVIRLTVPSHTQLRRTRLNRLSHRLRTRLRPTCSSPTRRPRMPLPAIQVISSPIRRRLRQCLSSSRPCLLVLRSSERQPSSNSPRLLLCIQSSRGPTLEAFPRTGHRWVGLHPRLRRLLINPLNPCIRRSQVESLLVPDRERILRNQSSSNTHRIRDMHPSSPRLRSSIRPSNRSHTPARDMGLSRSSNMHRNNHSRITHLSSSSEVNNRSNHMGLSRSNTALKHHSSRTLPSRHSNNMVSSNSSSRLAHRWDSSLAVNHRDNNSDSPVRSRMRHLQLSPIALGMGLHHLGINIRQYMSIPPSDLQTRTVCIRAVHFRRRKFWKK